MNIQLLCPISSKKYYFNAETDVDYSGFVRFTPPFIPQTFHSSLCLPSLKDSLIRCLKSFK